MNLTIGNARTNAWKSIKTQYVVAACSLALAATAVVGIGTWRDSGPAYVAAKQPGLNLSADRYYESAPRLILVIAGSELQALEHRASILRDSHLEPGLSFSHFVVANAEEEAEVAALADAMSSEQAIVGSSLWIVDLRRPAVAAPLNPPSASASPSVSRQATSGPQVAFILVADKAGADRARAYEEVAQWVRHDNLVPEPNRSIVTLVAGNPTESAQAQSLIDDAIAASNFSDSNPAPQFTIVDLR